MFCDTLQKEILNPQEVNKLSLSAEAESRLQKLMIRKDFWIQILF